MTDGDIVSLEAFRERRNDGGSGSGPEPQIVSFSFSPEALETLDALVDRLEAPSRGDALAVAMEILRITVMKLDEGRSVIAVDGEGRGDTFFVDPRTVFTTPKTPA